MSVVGQAFVEVLPLSTGFAGSLQRQLQTQVGAAQKAIDGTMTPLQSIGKKVTLGLAAGTVAVIAASAKAAVSFDSLTLTLVTGAGESQRNLGKVRQSILDLAPAMGTSAKDLTNGLYMIESAGFHGSAGLTVLKAAAEGAKVGNADLATVANAVTTALTDYHLPAAQAASVTSMLVEAVASGKTHMQDLAGALSTVLPVAAAAHINLAQVTGALATMTAQGISAQEAGQNVAGTIRALQAPSIESVKVMNQFGVNVADLTQNLGQRGLTGSLQVLVEAIGKQMGPNGMVLVNTFKQSQSAAKDAQVEFAHLPPSLRGIGQALMDGTMSQAQYRKALKGMGLENRQLISEFKGTIDQTRGFSDALKNGTPQAQTMGQVLSQMLGGATGLNTALALTGPNMTTFQTNVSNIASAGKNGAKEVQGFALVQKDLGFQFSQAKAAVGAMAIELGQHLLPFIETGIRVGADAVRWLTRHKLALEAIALVIGGALMAVTGSYIILLAGKFLSVIGRAASSVASLVTKILGMGSASTVSAAEQDAAATTTEATNAALSASIDSLNASVQALVTTLGGELPAALDAVQMAEEETAAVSESTGGGLGPIGIAIGAIVIGATLLATHWKQVWRVVREVAGEAWKWIDEHVVRPITSVVEPALKGITHIVTDVVHGIETAFDAIRSWFEKWWPVLLPIVTAVFLGPLGLLIGVVVDEIILHWHTLVHITEDVFHAIAAAFHFLFDPIVPYIVTGWHLVEDVTRLVWDGIKLYFEVWWTVVKTTFTVALAVVEGALKLAWDNIKAAVLLVWDGIKTYFEIWWALVKAIVQIGWDVIKTIFTVALDLITGKWGAAWGAIEKGWDTFWSIIKSTAKTAWDDFTGFFTGAFSIFESWWNTAWGAVAGTLSGIWDGIKSGAKGLWGDVSGIFSTGISDVEKLINDMFINPINAVLGVFGVHISPLGGGGGGSGNAKGQTASGATARALTSGVPGAEAGMIVNTPTVLVGEGRRQYPEAVIPTDPRYHDRAVSLLGWAADALGLSMMPGLKGGGLFGTGIGPSFGPNIAGAVSSAFGAVKDALQWADAHAIAPLIDAAAGTAEGLVGRIPPSFIGHMAAGAVKKVAEAIKAMLGGGKGKALAGMIPTGAHLGLIAQALGMAGAGASPGNEAAVNIIVTHESGWNPNAVNLWDSNAKAGTPSTGLMQTIRPTFEKYRLASLPDDMTDPLADLVAGIRYANSRYGSVTNVPGVAAVAHGGAYVGYDNGGWLMPGLTMAYNGTGRPEAVTSPTGGGPGRGITVMPGGINVSVTLGAGETGPGVQQLVAAGVRQGVAEALHDVAEIADSHSPAGTGGR